MSDQTTEAPKFLQDRIRDIDSRRCIVVLEEKHGTRYLDPRDWGGIVQVALHVFNQRDKQDRWYPETKPKEPVAPADLPAGSDAEVVKFHASRVTRYKLSLKSFLKELQEWELLEKARSGVGWAAFLVLRDRKDAEYEGWEIENLECPKGAV